MKEFYLKLLITVFACIIAAFFYIYKLRYKIKLKQYPVIIEYLEKIKSLLLLFSGTNKIADFDNFRSARENFEFYVKKNRYILKSEIYEKLLSINDDLLWLIAEKTFTISVGENLEVAETYNKIYKKLPELSKKIDKAIDMLNNYLQGKFW